MEAIGGGSSAGDDNGRASKKKAFNKLIPSSVHKVLSNDDLLIQILLLLPVISLHLFKRVSKQWLSLITSPHFISKRTQISRFDPPSGLFFFNSALSYEFLSFYSRKKVKRSSTFTCNLEILTNYDIMQSCNGLLLCFGGNKDYIIYNPLNSMFKMLPPIHPLNYKPRFFLNDFKLAFDPTTKPPHYKVVHFGGVQDDADVDGVSIRIQTYSSASGVWTVWDDQFPSSSFRGFGGEIYCNGAIHWLDEYEPFHFKLEFVDRLVLTKIQTPLTRDRKLFGCYGSLLLLCYPSRKLLNIYEMKNGSSEWSITYIVNLDNMLRRTWKFPEDFGCDNIVSIFFGEREEDSFMVMELSGKVLLYKFVTETVTTLLDLGEGVGLSNCHDFVASFAHF